MAKIATSSPPVASVPVPPSSDALAAEEISVEIESRAFSSKVAQPHSSSSPDSLS